MKKRKPVSLWKREENKRKKLRKAYELRLKWLDRAVTMLIDRTLTDYSKFVGFKDRETLADIARLVQRLRNSAS